MKKIGAGDRLKTAWLYCQEIDMKKVGTGDRLKAALEYCRPGGIRVRKTREYRRQAARLFQERHGGEPKYILCGRMRGTMAMALRRRTGKGLRGYRWLEKIGYSVEDMVKHFRNELKKLNKHSNHVWTWQNVLDGKLWIDHIIPVSAFNFTKPEDEDFKRCWALENLQLLPPIENIKKGAKLSKSFQPSLRLG